MRTSGMTMRTPETLNPYACFLFCAACLSRQSVRCIRIAFERKLFPPDRVDWSMQGKCEKHIIKDICTDNRKKIDYLCIFV